MLTEKEILEMQELIKESKRSYDYDLESPPFSHYYAEIAEKALNENNELRKRVKELSKGQHTLMQSRRKWKNRYYKERQKRKEADESVWQIYLDYQDIGNMYFDLDEKVQNIINNLKAEYKELTQSVKRYEEMRRNCQADSFYKKSYQITIHKLNAKRETIKSIIEILEDKEK